MRAVEFQTRIDDGKINIPDEYLHEISSDVKIIILYENPTAAPKKNTLNKSIKGIISQYANPELMPIEKEAWGEAVKEKHAAD
ncbi:MAG: hypothetical protein FWE42_07245 [Defluviitaleaceae bacterium]|nr:hypothetical protein [Defluviitaleaceae bacterium]